MNTKVCSRCSKEKPYTDFHKRSDRPIGIQSHCKECQKIRKDKYLLTSNGKAKVKEFGKNYYWNNRDYVLGLNKDWRENHKKERSIYNSIYEKNYRKRSKKDISKYTRKYLNKRYLTDSRFRLNCRMSAAIRRSLKGNRNGFHWEELVDYTLQDLTRHLKSTLPDKYNWNDYVNGAKLHIDHIIPVSVFNFKTADDIDFKRCWALDNLRLLSAVENMSKSNKINRPFQPSFAFGIPQG